MKITKLMKIIEMDQRITKNHENQTIHLRIITVMKILEIHKRINKILKIQKIYLRVKEHHENLRNPSEN